MSISMYRQPSTMAMRQRTLGSLDANLLEALGLLHGPDDSLDQLLNLLVQTANVGVLFGRLLVHLHGLDSAVVFGGEGIEDQVRVLVYTDEIAGLELFVVYKTNEGEEDGLTRRRLDDGRFANSGGVEVDVGAFFSGFFIDIKIEDLDDVSDEVW